MSRIGYGTSAIVTDGLVLHLDSVNPKSYPGTGTTWYDLSGNRNHGILVGFTGSTASTTSGFDPLTKLMMFDRHNGTGDAAVNNRIVVNNSNSLDGALCQSGVTIEMWAKETSYVCTALTKWNSSWEVYYCSNLVFRIQGTGAVDLRTSVASSPGTWRHIVSTHSGTLAKVFINGVQVSSLSNTISGQNLTNNISIGAYENGNYSMIGALPVYRLYNRPLTDSEILQNYNSGKNRF